MIESKLQAVYADVMFSMLHVKILWLSAFACSYWTYYTITVQADDIKKQFIASDK